MGPNEYQILAERTECNQTTARTRLKQLVGGKPVPVRLNHAVLGLAGEVGELATAVEHWVYYGQDLDTTNIAEELGDCLWYIAEACNALGFSLEGIMGININKLKKRYPDKYDAGLAEEKNRNRDAEREVVMEAISDPKLTASQEQAHEDYKSIVCTTCDSGGCMVDSEKLYHESYDRLCTACGRTRIHKTNTSGLCPDCGAALRAANRE